MNYPFWGLPISYNPQIPPPPTSYLPLQYPYNISGNPYTLNFYHPFSEISTPLLHPSIFGPRPAQSMEASRQERHEVKDRRKKKKNKISNMVASTRSKLTRKKKNEVEKIVETQWDRNITSNILKIYLRDLRSQVDDPTGYIRDIIDKTSDSYTLQQFRQHLNTHLGPHLNYIRFDFMRNICKNSEGIYHPEFSKAIRISLKTFFKIRIYMMNTIRSKFRRYIKLDYLKKGSLLYSYLIFGEKSLVDDSLLSTQP